MTRSPALAQIENHVSAAAALVERAQVADEERRRLREQLAAIRARVDDPALYLAVLGEFSSGKSSLINALIRERLLPTSALVSTCVVTELRGGRDASFEVSFAVGPTLTYPKERDALRAKVSSFGLDPPQDARDLLQALTADQRIAPHVDLVRVWHAGPLLENDVVVLDTPGISSQHPEHTARATGIARSADLFIVVIPSLSPLSDVFRSFLREELGDHLKRAIFVLTKMAHVEADEQQGLVEFVERRVAADLELQSPIVLPLSLRPVLDGLAQSRPRAAGRDVWIERFEAFETHLADRLRSERAIAVSERLIALLELLVADVQLELQSAASSLHERAEILAANPVTDLRAFASAQSTKGRERLGAAHNRERAAARARVQERRKKTLKKIDKSLEQASSSAELNAAATAGAETLLKRARNRLQEDARASIRALADEATSVLRDFDDAFEAHYHDLERLAGETVAMGRGSGTGMLDTHAALASVRALHSELQSSENTRALGGAAAGAALGTLFMPGPGTLLGGGLGALTSFLFGPTLDEQRSATRSRLNPPVERAFTAAQKQILGAIDKQAEAAGALLDERVSLYLEHYAGLIEKTAAEHRAESRALERSRAATRAGLRDCEELLDRLRELNAALAPESETAATASEAKAAVPGR
jgi:hypothetical protein